MNRLTPRWRRPTGKTGSVCGGSAPGYARAKFYAKEARLWRRVNENLCPRQGPQFLTTTSSFCVIITRAPVEIFNVNLPTIEKLTLFALLNYYHATVSRVPTHEELTK